MKTHKFDLVFLCIAGMSVFTGTSLGYNYYSDLVQIVGSYLVAPPVLHIFLLVLFLILLVFGVIYITRVEKRSPLKGKQFIGVFVFGLCVGFSFAMVHRLLFASFVDILILTR